VDAVHDVVGILGRRRGRQPHDAATTCSTSDGPPVRGVVLGPGGVRVVRGGVRVRVHRLGDDLVRGALGFGMTAAPSERCKAGQEQRHERRHQRLAREHGNRLHAERQQHGPGHPSGQQDGLRVLLLLAPACEQPPDRISLKIIVTVIVVVVNVQFLYWTFFIFYQPI